MRAASFSLFILLQLAPGAKADCVGFAEHSRSWLPFVARPKALGCEVEIPAGLAGSCDCGDGRALEVSLEEKPEGGGASQEPVTCNDVCRLSTAQAIGRLFRWLGSLLVMRPIVLLQHVCLWSLPLLAMVSPKVGFSTAADTAALISTGGAIDGVARVSDDVILFSILAHAIFPSQTLVVLLLAVLLLAGALAPLVTWLTMQTPAMLQGMETRTLPTNTTVIVIAFTVLSQLLLKLVQYVLPHSVCRFSRFSRRRCQPGAAQPHPWAQPHHYCYAHGDTYICPHTTVPCHWDRCQCPIPISLALAWHIPPAHT